MKRLFAVLALVLGLSVALPAATQAQSVCDRVTNPLSYPASLCERYGIPMPNLYQTPAVTAPSYQPSHWYYPTYQAPAWDRTFPAWCYRDYWTYWACRFE
jgi:hypothetical protein